MAEEFEKQLTCLRVNTEKYITFLFQYWKKLQELIKIKKKLQKQYPTGCNLLMVQDIWQPHYQVFLMILVKEFMKLKVNTDAIIKNVKLVELNTKIETAFLNMQTLKMI